MSPRCRNSQGALSDRTVARLSPTHTIIGIRHLPAAAFGASAAACATAMSPRVGMSRVIRPSSYAERARTFNDQEV